MLVPHATAVASCSSEPCRALRVPRWQVHASACVPPKWRSGPRVDKAPHGGQQHAPKTFSVPEVHCYPYSADEWKRAWSPVGGHASHGHHADVSTPNGKLSNGIHLRTLSSGSLESVDIPLTG